MAKEIVQNIKITSDSSDAKRDIKELENTMTSAMAKGQVAAEALVGAVSLIGSAINDGINKLVQYEESNIALEAALKTSGHEVDNNARTLNQQSSSLEKLSGISDEVIRKTQAFALNAGVSARDVDKFTKASVRMSNTLNMDLSSAMRQLTKSLSGAAGELNESLPGVKDLTVEQLKSGEAIDLVNSMWSENLGLLNKGIAGKVNKLSNAFSSLAEAFVIDLTPGKSSIADIIESTATALETAASVVQKHGSIGGILALGDIAFFGGKHLDEDVLEEARGAPVDKSGLTGPSGKKPAGAPPVDKKNQRELERRRKQRQRELEAEEREKKRLAEREAAQKEKFWKKWAKKKEDLQKQQDEDRAAAEIHVTNAVEQRKLEIQEKMLEERRLLEEEAVANIEAIQMESIQRIADMIQSYSMGLIDGVIAQHKEAERITKERAKIEQKIEKEHDKVKKKVLVGRLERLNEEAAQNKIAFDEMAKDFLIATGRMLFGEGLSHLLSGVAQMLAGDPRGIPRSVQGGVMMAAGAGMMGGGMAINTGGGGGATPSGGGGTPGPDRDTDVDGDAGRDDSVSQNLNFFVVGELSEAQVITIRRGLQKQEGKGF